MAFCFRPRLGVTGDHRVTVTVAGWRQCPETNSVRACPRRTRTAPIYSAQFRPSVRKRTSKVGRELRDPTGPDEGTRWR